MREFQKNHIIEDICKQVCNELSGFKSVLSIILIGSCARGEETYFTGEDGKELLYSDIEFFALVSNGTEIDEISKKIKFLNKSIFAEERSPVFEISIGFLFLNAIKRLDKRFIIFETTQCGRCIYGDEKYLQLLPNITVRNINKSNLISIVNQRLFHVLSEWEKSDAHEKKYCIARNTLDILTVYLPFKGYLIATYRSRINFFNNNPHVSKNEFEKSFGRRLHDYFEMKLDLASTLYENYNEKAMLAQYCKDMRSLLVFLQNEHSSIFLRDRHRIIRDIAHFNRKELYFELKRPQMEQKLAKEMLCLLENGSWESSSIKQASINMDELYRKR